LRHRTIERVNDVWAADVTYIPMAHGSWLWLSGRNH
jgi:hypothetical protein